MFKLHELTDIVRQNSDPEIEELLNRVRVGEQSQSHVAAKHVMADTNISHWSENHFRSYMTNHLVGKQNAERMNNPANTIFIIHDFDGRADGHTSSFQYNLTNGIDIENTENSKAVLNPNLGGLFRRSF